MHDSRSNLLAGLLPVLATYSMSPSASPRVATAPGPDKRARKVRKKKRKHLRRKRR